MQEIRLSVIVSENEEGWNKSYNEKKEEWLFNFAVAKIMPTVESPKFEFDDDFSAYLTLLRKKVYMKNNKKQYPFEVVIKDDKKSLVSYTNLKQSKPATVNIELKTS